MLSHAEDRTMVLKEIAFQWQVYLHYLQGEWDKPSASGSKMAELRQFQEPLTARTKVLLFGSGGGE